MGRVFNYPREESNLYSQIRSLLSYPLDDEDIYSMNTTSKPKQIVRFSLFIIECVELKILPLITVNLDTPLKVISLKELSLSWTSCVSVRVLYHTYGRSQDFFENFLEKIDFFSFFPFNWGNLVQKLGIWEEISRKNVDYHSAKD